MADDFTKFLPIVVALVVVFVGGLGAGFIMHTPTSTSSSNNSSSSGVYHLTLVITDNNMYSVNNTQPAYYVLADNGSLVSSASIHVPANQQIKLTIINYDDGNDSVPAQYLPVVGTKNNVANVVSDDNLNSTAGPDNTTIDIGSVENMTISAAPAQWVSHTFTVLDTNHLINSTGVNMVVNIPVEPSSTTTALVTLTTKGTYHWACEVPCGDGAMGTPGWMEGSLIVG